MPYSYMDLLELSKFLGLDIRQAEKMANRGEIPCQKVSGTLRFNRAQITEWLQQHMSSLNRNKLANMDAGITAHRDVPTTDTLIIPMLKPEAISLALPARTKKSVLKELVVLAEKTGNLYDPDTLLQTLTDREELCSTAMEGGIAIPHPRQPQPYIIADTILAIGKTNSGIGYGAPDGRLTDLFFMTCSQDDRHHLHILARLCRMLHDSDFVEELRHCEDVEKVAELMHQREMEVINL